MPKIRKVKRRKTYKANVNRKRLRDKLRKLPEIGCKDIKDAWINTKSIRQNLGDMGLAYDANESMKIPSLRDEILSETKRKNTEDSSESEEDNNVKNVPSKIHIALKLEAEAKAPRQRNFRLPKQQVQFVTYLMDKYDDDYVSMARDKKNYYQMTWRQIRAKINTFKNVPEQYAEYLVEKGEIVLDDPETLEETRKRISEENVVKYCAKKPKKIKQTSEWLEESVEEFDKGDKLVDIEEISNEKTEGSENKLKLFSDDDEDESEDEAKKSESKKTLSETDVAKNGKKRENLGKNKKIHQTTDRNAKILKTLEKLESSDSEEELEGSEDEDDEAGFVDLKDLSDEELSDDDILDNGEFVTDSDEESE